MALPNNSHRPVASLAALENSISSVFFATAGDADLAQAGTRIATTIAQHLASSLTANPRAILTSSGAVADLLVGQVAAAMALKNAYTALARAIDQGLLLTDVGGRAGGDVYDALDRAAGIQQLLAAELNDAFMAITATGK